MCLLCKYASNLLLWFVQISRCIVHSNLKMIKPEYWVYVLLLYLSFSFRFENLYKDNSREPVCARQCKENQYGHGMVWRGAVHDELGDSHICPLQPLERKITPTWSRVPNSTSGHATLHLQASRYLQQKLQNSSARQVKAFIFQGRLPSRMHLPPSASAVWKCSKAGRISASLLSPWM